MELTNTKLCKIVYKGIKQVDPIIDNIGNLVRIPNSMLKWVIKANIFHLITDPMIDIVVSVDCDTLFAKSAKHELFEQQYYLGADHGRRVNSLACGH